MSVRQLTEAKPTSREFTGGVAELRSQVRAAFDPERQFKQPVFPPPTSADPDAPATHDYLDVSTYEDHRGWPVLDLPQNRNDLYLQNYGTPLWNSPVYTSSGGRGLPFYADFHIHFEPVGARQTRMSVVALRARVLNGKALFIGHAGVNWYARYVSVAPTTIEEYVVLNYVADFLGAGMGPPRVPSR